MNCNIDLKMWKVLYNCFGYEISIDEFYLVDDNTRFYEVIPIPDTQCMYINVIAENDKIASSISKRIFYNISRHSA